MRKSLTLTAIGALTLATSAIVGGAYVTSSAMASGTPPDEGTGMVVLVNEGQSDAIVCVFTDMRDIEPRAVEGHPGDYVTGPGSSADLEGVATDAAHADWPGANPGDLGAQVLISGPSSSTGDVPGDVVHAQARPGTADECSAAREGLVSP